MKTIMRWEMFVEKELLTDIPWKTKKNNSRVCLFGLIYMAEKTLPVRTHGTLSRLYKTSIV